MPVKQTVPCTLVARRVSGSVVVPMSSIAPSTPPGTSARTVAATFPSSTSTWSTPSVVRTAAFAAVRVVENTVRPIRFARIAAAIPTEDVPPRTSSDCPGFASTPTVSDPYAVCSISGTAPTTDHGSVEVNGTTWLTATDTYSA